jgi:amino acid adenylation domain-containing protein/non-ribosomal peptide synthase protein (TIGR01720 family)
VTDVRQRLTELSDDERAVLEARLDQAMAARATSVDRRILPRDRSVPAPLSFSQQREWATERLRSANNISSALHVEGALDVDVLGRALAEIVRRHEVLRSTIEMTDRGAVQVVGIACAVPTPVVDLSDRSPVEQGERLRRAALDEVTRPFDATGPLMLRVTLFRLAVDHHLVLLSLNHAASDAWSLAVLVRELVVLYPAFRDGELSPLPELELQFADFAAWERGYLDQERIESQLRYWRAALDGIPARLTLPADRPSPSRPTFAGALHRTQVEAELTGQVHRFAQQEHTSLFMLLLAATTVTLHRYTGQEDLVVGSTIAGRHRIETEALIGCFVNLLPLRTQVTGQETLRDVVRGCRRTTTAAYDHQAVSFDRIVDALGPQRASSQTPLIQLLLNLVSTPDWTIRLPGLQVSPQSLEPGDAPVDLTLYAISTPSGIDLNWHYRVELFDHETIAGFAAQVIHVLETIVTRPELRVADVALVVRPALAGGGDALRPPDLAEALPAGPAAEGGTPAAGDTLVADVVAWHARHCPDSAAVEHAGLVINYAQLDAAATRLAARLRERGTGLETPVGILVGRSPRLAVAILAVLKSGGFFIPLDPDHPAERLAFMTGDAGMRLVLTEQAHAAKVPQLDTLLLDEPGQELFTGPADPPPLAPVARESSLAYAIYTSGSTGQPKAAMIEHRSLSRFTREVAQRLGLSRTDRFLQFASPSFDVLVEELFPIWWAGGAVVIPQERLLGGSTDLAEFAGRAGLTVMELPTAYWHEWVRELVRTGRRLPPSLRCVIVGGERILADRLAAWQRLGVPMAHVYGLTEATVSSTFCLVEPDPSPSPQPNLPIGTPLPSVQLRVLDASLALVPHGAVGELYVAGVSIARGYLGRGQLTAARFVADPHAPGPGQRMYRTGDLVRRRADGELEFLSRVDAQIKIRGFRIEPGEVEAALCRHPGIGEAVVVVHEPEPGDRRLAAYVVPSGEALPAVPDLRRFLEQQLPAYLIPSFFVPLTELPLTANGKVDHSRLAAPQSAPRATPRVFVEPGTPLERQLAELIATVVGVDRVGTGDNFFEIGGDSILAIQVVGKAARAGIQLSPLDLFSYPTVEELARVASPGAGRSADQGVVCGPVQLAPLQRWFLDLDVAEPHHWNMAGLLALNTDYDQAILRRALSQLLLHHDGLRLRVTRDRGEVSARIDEPGAEPAFDVVDLAHLPEPEQLDRMSAEAARLQSCLDLSSGPMVRAALFTFGSGHRPRLLVICHHLVVDAVSLRILFEDLESACEQLAAGRQVRLPAKTTSWADWAARLCDHATRPDVLAESDYWTGVRSEAVTPLPVRPGWCAEDNTVATAEIVSGELTAAQTEVLLRTAPATLGCRINDLLLTALSRTLSRWTSGSVHRVALEGHGREPFDKGIDTVRTVGWLGTVYPVLLEGDLGRGPLGTLGDVAAALRAVPSGGIGWHLLHRPPGSAGVDAQLSFNYVGQYDQLMPASGAFAPAFEPIGPLESPAGRRPYLIEINASVGQNRLTVQWRYSTALHGRAEIERLSADYLAQLRTLIDAARGAHPPPVDADFPLARVDRSQLDGLLSRLARG